MGRTEPLFHSADESPRSPAECGRAATLSDASYSRRVDYLVLAFVCVSLVAVKMLMGLPLDASALFSDDYNSLNRGIYFSRGQFQLTEAGYPFQDVSAGLLYFLVLTPWTFFPPDMRITFMFFINTLLSAGGVVFASLAIWKVSRSRSWFVPAVLATMPAQFLFSFYAMTENLLFFFICALSYLVAEPVKVARGGRLFALLLVLSGMAVTRAPGVVAFGAVLVSLALHQRAIGRLRTVVVGALSILASCGSYYLYMLTQGDSRENMYAQGIRDTVTNIAGLRFLVELTAAQLEYALVAGAGVMLPLALLGLRSVSHREDRALASQLYFLGSGAILFLGIALVHLLHNDPSGWYVYGRYSDPTLLFTVIGALTFLCAGRGKLSIDAKFFAHCLVPLVFFICLRHLEPIRWSPVNQAGLSFFCDKAAELPLMTTLVWMCFVALAPLAVWFLPALRSLVLLGVLVFNVSSINPGYDYTADRAHKIEFGVAGYHWLAQNAAENSVVCYDWDVVALAAPGSMKRVENVYRAMMFYTFPREFMRVKSDSSLEKCDFLYTLESERGRFNFEAVWSNGTYALLRPSATNPAN